MAHNLLVVWIWVTQLLWEVKGCEEMPNTPSTRHAMMLAANGQGKLRWAPGADVAGPFAPETVSFHDDDVVCIGSHSDTSLISWVTPIKGVSKLWATQVCASLRSIGGVTKLVWPITYSSFGFG